jgi:hypothetical protein
MYLTPDDSFFYIEGIFCLGSKFLPFSLVGWKLRVVI